MENFQKHFADRIVPVTETGCWLWLGAVNEKGYGYVTPPGGKLMKAHRAAWVEVHGPIPEGMFICHKCDVPSCVCPSHLFLGTASDNNLDKQRKGRGRWKKDFMFA